MKRLLAILLTLCALSQSTFAYSDLEKSHPHYDGINYLSEQGILNGYLDSTFKPDSAINRAELTKIIVENFYSEEFQVHDYSYSCFSDISPDQWFTPYVCFAKAKDIIHGYDDNTFRPAQNVKFPEALKILLNAVGHHLPASEPWYKNHVNFASDNNLIPLDIKLMSDDLSRGQVADLLTRIIKFQDASLDEYLGAKANWKMVSNAASTYLYMDSEQDFDPLADAWEIELPESHKLNVQFTSQAPHGNWSIPYNEACEEASMTMIDYYYRGLILDKSSANAEILDLVNWETERQYIIDVGTQDMAEIAKAYYGYNAKIYRDNDVSIETIKTLLVLGYPVIVPVAGDTLANPNYKAPYHVVVVVGYDLENFIVHDPGTSSGDSYLYNQFLFLNSIHDWNGSKSTVISAPKAIMVMK